MPEFYIKIARKIFFPNFRGHVPPLPPSPTPMGKNQVKFGHFVNFSYIFFGQKFRAPLKLTELLRL